ncbi:MAG: hypothetical protein WC307_06825 [Candidatus Nanoarchaeia archaeon]
MTEHYIVKWVKTLEGKVDGLESHYNQADVLAIVKTLKHGEQVIITGGKEL